MPGIREAHCASPTQKACRGETCSRLLAEAVRAPTNVRFKAAGAAESGDAMVDHCRAIASVLERSPVGEVWNVGGRAERTNMQVVHTICDMLGQLRPRADGRSYREQIKHVQDRPGHDRRYAIDDSKIAQGLGWTPSVSFEQGIRSTVEWYLEHQDWVESVTSGSYRQWIDQQYGARQSA